MSFGSPYVTLPEFSYHRPRDLAEALSLLKAHGDEAKIMAGGVGLMAFMKERLMSPTHVIDIKDIQEFKQLEQVEGGVLRVGAGVTISELVEGGVLRRDYAVLHEALSKVADPMIRRRATLVGNLCEAIPWVDSPPALISLDAAVEIAGTEGTRTIPVSAFIRGPVDIDLGPAEVVSVVTIPHRAGLKSAFEKFTVGSEFSLASVAVAIWNEGRKKEARVVFGAVNSIPVRVAEMEEEIRDGITPAAIRRAADVASQKVECMDDVLASSPYRKHLAKVITIKVLRRLMGS